MPSSNARLSKSAFALGYSGPSVKVSALAVRQVGGMSVRKTAAKFEVNPSTVQGIAHPFDDAEHASVAVVA